MPAAPPPDTRAVSFSPVVEEIPPQPLGIASPEVAPKLGAGIQAESTPTSAADVKSTVPDEVAGAEPEGVVIPEDESPEDAQTRREIHALVQKGSHLSVRTSLDIASQTASTGVHQWTSRTQDQSSPAWVKVSRKTPGSNLLTDATTGTDKLYVCFEGR